MQAFTSVHNVFWGHLIACSRRFVFVYPRWLIPVIGRNEAKLDGCFRKSWYHTVIQYVSLFLINLWGIRPLTFGIHRWIARRSGIHRDIQTSYWIYLLVASYCSRRPSGHYFALQDARKSSHGMEIHPHWVWISPRWPCVVFGCPPYRSHRNWVQSQVSRIGLREAKAPPVRVFHALSPKEVAKRTATTVSKSTSKSKWTDKYNREQHSNMTHMTLSLSLSYAPTTLRTRAWSLKSPWSLVE